MGSINPVEDAVELLDEQSLRARVQARRAAGSALLSRQLGMSAGSGDDDSDTVLDALVARIEAHRGLLDFELATHRSLLGSLVLPFKRLERRLLRSYLVQQEAFNNYALEFLRALALERKAERRSRPLCDGTCARDAHERPPELRGLLLRRHGVAEAAAGNAGPSASNLGLAGLAEYFVGCRLVLGAGPGAEQALAGLRARGVEAVALAHCPACQAAARELGVRVADGDLSDYPSAAARYRPDGVALVGVVEQLTEVETVRFMALMSETLPPGSRVVLVTPSLATHVHRLLHESHRGGAIHAHSVELLAGLATTSGFEVLGVTFL